ncbi:hypothetical protein BGX27_001677, partial [Mortierella sp. AM989]
TKILSKRSRLLLIKQIRRRKKNETDESRNNSYKPADELVIQAGNSAVDGKEDESVANPHELSGEPVAGADNSSVNSIHVSSVDGEAECLRVDSVELEEDDPVDPTTRYAVGVILKFAKKKHDMRLTILQTESYPPKVELRVTHGLRGGTPVA